MSFTTGEWYVWRSGDETDDHAMIHFGGPHDFGGDLRMPLRLFDEIVVMRAAQLREANPAAVRRAENRAVTRWGGNLGCDALLAEHDIETNTEKIIRRAEEAAKHEGTDAVDDPL